MKKHRPALKLILVFVAILSVFAGCKKDKNDNANNALIGKYKLVNFTSKSGEVVTPVYDQLHECTRDQTIELTADELIAITFTKEICEGTEPATGAWYLNENKLTIIAGGIQLNEYKIIKNEGSELVLELTVPDGDKSVINTVTFARL
ncbi:lipocalin family protein [Pseudobacter ginsenosidimutans]|uniref:Lipocalin-like protein n=1 Tax=Pseudobacter ginsenosidimutans TaxID=661488 RepID=A0A4Q7N6C3_9BACT|nr:lipocalin family protein [Pseudobacter ginsenosidimutans]QEC45134.1 lipocalin family protein [Pseudobacter ginsenosidimutans]RZS76631.1 lipocalin-like protein [Pseudobacter ginsenosidimutans]